MNRILESVTMIIIALLLSISFTGQHPSYAGARLRTSVVIMSSDEMTAAETLTKSYIERELRDLDYVEVVDKLEKMSISIHLVEPKFVSGSKTGRLTLFYILTVTHKDCDCVVLTGYSHGNRNDLRDMCAGLVAQCDQRGLKKAKP